MIREPDYLLPEGLRLRPIWLNEAEAQQLVGRAPSTLRRWRFRGEVKAQKLFGRWRYERASLEACAREQRRRYDERECPGFKRAVLRKLS